MYVTKIVDWNTYFIVSYYVTGVLFIIGSKASHYVGKIQEIFSVELHSLLFHIFQQIFPNRNLLFIFLTLFSSLDGGDENIDHNITWIINMGNEISRSIR